MNFKNFVVVVLIVAAFASCNRVPKTGKADFKSQIDSVSYALGYIEAKNVDKSFKQLPFDSLDRKDIGRIMAKTALKKKYQDFRSDQFLGFNEDMFYKGFLNQFVYGKSYFNDMTSDMFLRKAFGEAKEKKDSIRNKEGVVNLKAGQDFLAKNGKKEGVVTTESGLQYEILKEGTGKVASDKDKVKCVYHGTLLDGTVFDSSLERKDTTTFRVTGVIKGWTEALQMMPEGSKWRLYIPEDLAYGKGGSGEKIGPNSTLIFDIDLVEVL